MIFKILVYSTFFLFSLGQLGRLSFLGQQINIYFYELPLFLTLLFLLISYRLKPLNLVWIKYRIFYFFFASLSLSYLLSFSRFNAQENVISFLYMVRMVGYFLYFWYVFFATSKDKESKKTVQAGFLFFLAATILTSILQYVFYPNLRNLSYLGWDPHFLRSFGLFFDTSVAGAIFGMLFFSNLIGKRNLIILLFFSVLILLTFSRGLYLSIGPTIIIYLLSRREYKLVILLLCLATIFILFLPKPFGEGGKLWRTASIQSRIIDYQNAMKLWSKNQVFGIGYNRIRYKKKNLNIIDPSGYKISHSGASFSSSFLIILITGGVVGLLLFLLVLLKLAAFSSLAKYAVLFLSLYSITDNILLHPFILFLLFQMIIISSSLLFGKSAK